MVMRSRDATFHSVWSASSSRVKAAVTADSDRRAPASSGSVAVICTEAMRYSGVCRVPLLRGVST
jgi:hypothetical protein